MLCQFNTRGILFFENDDCVTKLIWKISLHVPSLNAILFVKSSEKSSPDLESVTIPGFFIISRQPQCIVHVESNEEIFLKTIIPRRKATNKYVSEERWKRAFNMTKKRISLNPMKMVNGYRSRIQKKKITSSSSAQRTRWIKTRESVFEWLQRI